MRALLAALGAVLAFAGCATAHYAEVWHKKPQLTGPPGNGRLATVEERLSRAMHEERTKPLAAMADCLEALQFAADELKRNTRNTPAVRYSNFFASRIFSRRHDSSALLPQLRNLRGADACSNFLIRETRRR